MEFKKEKVAEAVDALRKHLEVEASKKKSSLFDLDESINLVVALKKVPQQGRTKPFRLPLPNPIHTEDKEVCLFVKDPQRQYKDLLKEKNVDFIKKVVGVQKLREKYKAYEQKRALCSDFDFFLADDRVLPLLPRLIGKTFYDKKKYPIAVDMKKKDLAKELTRALEATYFHINNGNCSVVKAGRTVQTVEEVVANIDAIVSNLKRVVPEGWDNVQSLHIKTPESVSLPIYLSKPSSSS
uniref:Ribosomal L1 domain-containing protein 1 n=1 Tax=Palpitomonas bilix TaxID=652834 RepID=A0A7S3GEC6_9EUKA|mmetsp:Transcript_45784/g.118337  ORF Transcript_45784/g.118337 Transcript_45784/m.118337 type:complete len:239 (+) Transcript_45784:22-738(+)